jgi:AcrR family transcriptional regulator
VRTRQALVQAAINQLAAGGAAATTTTRVAREAGVSQGALFRHFPTKNDLLEAATIQVLGDLFDEFEGSLVAAFAADKPLRTGIALLWCIYCDPRLAGVFELFLAARTDPDLQLRLAPVMEAHAEREVAFARLLFPDASHRPDFGTVVLGLLSTLQGAAIASFVMPGEAGSFELQVLAELVRRELGEPVFPGGSDAP